MSIEYSSEQLAKILGSSLSGSSRKLNKLANINSADIYSVVVINNKKQLLEIRDKEIGLVVLANGLESNLDHIHCQDIRFAFAKLSQIFDNNPAIAASIHESAIIHPSAIIAQNVDLAENVVLKAGVNIQENSQIGANTVIGENTNIGKDCKIYPSVSIYPNSQIKNRVIIHSGTVIGSDGFGYALGPKGATKIHHLGNVILEDDVEIGSNCSIDRATLGATTIGSRSKIDNLCQIAHNVVLGSDCLIAACTVIAGSSTVGKRVIMGGGVGVVDHVTIGNDVKIRGYSGVTKSIPSGETWAGEPARPYKKYSRNMYLQNRLEQIWQIVKELKSD